MGMGSPEVLPNEPKLRGFVLLPSQKELFNKKGEIVLGEIRLQKTVIGDEVRLVADLGQTNYDGIVTHVEEAESSRSQTDLDPNERTYNITVKRGE